MLKNQGLERARAAPCWCSPQVTSGSRREEGEVAGAAKVALQGCRAERVRAERVHGQVRVSMCGAVLPCCASLELRRGLAIVVLRASGRLFACMPPGSPRCPS